ncbi:alkyl hydroperoxide reductase [Flammeovirgaceae bacterium 311]|nr:alkyl hydroperoxide reductase [Flammeovirgaceae bacterium 311]
MRKVPTWVKPLLLGGGALNLLLAAIFMLLPEGSRALLFGSAVSVSVQAIQMYGILLAVLGFGYIAVSLNPFSNKAVLLMGLVANLLFALLLPAISGGMFWQHTALQLWVLVALVWCGLMVAILNEIAKARQQPQALANSYHEPLSKTLIRFRTQRGKSLLQLSNERPTMVVFLRKLGSNFCRETLSDIRDQRKSIEQRGTQIVLVHLADVAEASEVLQKYDLADLHHISDPSGIMYNAFGLKQGSLTKLLSWGVGIVDMLKRTPAQKGVNSVQEDYFRMPGVFLISNGEIVRSYKQRNPAQRPNLRQLSSSDQAA